jgi:hypothetical protein
MAGSLVSSHRFRKDDANVAPGIQLCAWERVISDRFESKRRVEECRRLAAIEPDEDDQAFWLRMADGWEKLANLAVRSNEKASPRRQHRQAAGDPAAIAKRDCGHRTPIRSLAPSPPSGADLPIKGHDRIMRKPIFFVVRDAADWSVEAEWPDGTIERVKTFKAELAALDWLSLQSHAWLEWRGTDFGGAR